jgi:hypothetical protein
MGVDPNLNDELIMTTNWLASQTLREVDMSQAVPYGQGKYFVGRSCYARQ